MLVPRRTHIQTWTVLWWHSVGTPWCLSPLLLSLFVVVAGYAFRFCVAHTLNINQWIQFSSLLLQSWLAQTITIEQKHFCGTYDFLSFLFFQKCLNWQPTISNMYLRTPRNLYNRILPNPYDSLNKAFHHGLRNDLWTFVHTTQTEAKYSEILSCMHWILSRIPKYLLFIFAQFMKQYYFEAIYSEAKITRWIKKIDFRSFIESVMIC